MENFSEKLMNDIQQKILSDIGKTDFINVNYNNRVEIPSSLLNECYKRIDIENVKDQIVNILETEMAKKIVDKMMTEFAGDVKQIMCNHELRDDLKFYMRTKIKEMADSVRQIND